MVKAAAKGRKAGVVTLPFKPFLEALARTKLNIPLDRVLDDEDRKDGSKLANTVSDYRAALKLEKGKEGKAAPNTMAMVELFVEQLQESLKDKAPQGANLRAQLDAKDAELQALRDELEALKGGKTKRKSA